MNNKIKNKLESGFIVLVMLLGSICAVSSLAWMFFGMKKFIASNEAGGLFAIAVGIVCAAGGVTVLRLAQSAKSFVGQDLSLNEDRSLKENKSLKDWAKAKLRTANIPGTITLLLFAAIWMLFICGMGLLLLSEQFDQELISTTALVFLFISIGIALAGICTLWYRVLVTRHPE